MRRITFSLIVLVCFSAGRPVSQAVAADPTLAAVPSSIPNPLIDHVGFLQHAEQVAKLREVRRLTEEQFLEMARDPQVIVLDCRSAEKYKLLHIQGAKNLNFSDITADSLAEVIPTKTTQVLIYCNNNFRNAKDAFRSKCPVTSLNLHTWNTLHGYGYENVYELGPLLDVKSTKIPFAGTDPIVQAQRESATPTTGAGTAQQ